MFLSCLLVIVIVSYYLVYIIVINLYLHLVHAYVIVIYTQSPTLNHSHPIPNKLYPPSHTLFFLLRTHIYSHTLTHTQTTQRKVIYHNMLSLNLPIVKIGLINNNSISLNNLYIISHIIRLTWLLNLCLCHYSKRGNHWINKLLHQISNHYG